MEEIKEKRVGLGKASIPETVNEDVKRLAKAAGKTKEQWVEWAITKTVERIKNLKDQVEEINREEELTLKSIFPEGVTGTAGPGPCPAGEPGEPGEDGMRFIFHLHTGKDVYSNAESLEAAMEELGLNVNDYISYHDGNNDGR